jgi:hypothetical protein
LAASLGADRERATEGQTAVLSANRSQGVTKAPGRGTGQDIGDR